MNEPLSPMILYARLAVASAYLARQIQILDTHAPALAAPLDAAWVALDGLLEQLPDALAWDAERQEQEETHDA
jgi:hypothetical protein